jgi:integrase
MEFALAMERAEKMAGSGSLTEEQARGILADILKRTETGDVLRNYSVEDWFQEWLKGKKARKAAATVTRYGHVANKFIVHLGDRAKRPLHALVTRDIQNYLTKRLEEGCSPTTVSQDGEILRTILNQARREGLISVNPAEAAELPAGHSVERGTFTPAEVKMIVDAAEGEWKTVILLGYFTGARLTDCTEMPWASVDFVNSVVSYQPKKTSKTGQIVTVPLHPDLQAHLEGLAGKDKPEKFINPELAGLETRGWHGLSESFKRIVVKAGLDLQTVQGGGIRKISKRTFHALRHSFSSALANAGVAPELRMKLTGHKTEAIHQGYTHHELEVLRSAVGKLPALS